MAASDHLGPQWHVSPRRIPDNAMVTPGGDAGRNFNEMPYSGDHVYFTPDADRAQEYHDQMSEKFGHAFVHQVQPTGPAEPDPDDSHAYRSKSPLRVIRSQSRLPDQQDAEDIEHNLDVYNTHAGIAHESSGDERRYNLERAHSALADNKRMDWG